METIEQLRAALTLANETIANQQRELVDFRNALLLLASYVKSDGEHGQRLRHHAFKQALTLVTKYPKWL